MNNFILTHPDKLLFPEAKITKREVAEYYAKVSDLMVPHLKERPITLVRCTQDISKNCFYQKHWDKSMTEHTKAVSIEEKSKSAPYVLINNPKALLANVQLNVIEFHAWGSRADDIEKPDRLIFDLDPGPGILWKTIIQAAWHLGEELEKIKLQSFVKLTGGKGLHIVVPLRRTLSWEKLKQFSRDFSNHMQNLNPSLYTINMNKTKRDKKIFIDYFRNTRGATSVAPYSLRARPQASVALPVSWNELSKVKKPDAINISSDLESLDDNPWPNFFLLKQNIEKEKWLCINAKAR